MSELERETVLVTEYFHPDTASTGQLMTDLAVGLQKRGLDMTVYTGQPNYHSGENEKQPRASTYEGVRVKRIRAPQVRQSSLLRRLFNWGIFTIWMFITLLVSKTEKKREVLFVSNPPFLPIALWVGCRIRGWPYTYIVYDLYPDMAVEPGHLKRGGIIDRTWSYIHRFVFHDAENVVALGPVMQERIREKAGDDFDHDKLTIIHNWEEKDFITPTEKANNWFSQRHDLVDKVGIVYSGNIGDNHDLETVVRAATAFENEAVKFLIIGEGDKKQDIVELGDKLDLDEETIEFLPYQEMDDLPYSLTCGDVSVVSVSEGMRGVCVSSKIYTALAVGQPILVISHPDDDEARIVNRYDAGIHVRQGDVDGVVSAIKTWKNDPTFVAEQGRNAREAFENNFTKTQSITKYYHLLTGRSDI